MLQANGLSRWYGDFRAVDDVSFSIGRGEVVGLLGHNGAGKSTIMKMLTGFIEPSLGGVLVDGIDVQQQPQPAQAKMGYLPEVPPVYPELSVLDYLTFAAQMRGLSSADDVMAAVAATSLEDKAIEPIGALSRGYKQRLGVAQAILHRPQILILDEPSNGLDPTQIHEMRQLIRRLSEHATVILSTHILQEVNALCDRVLILRGGQLVVDESLSALTEATTVTFVTDPDVDAKTTLLEHPRTVEATSVAPGHWRITVGGDVRSAVPELASAFVAARIPILSIAPQSQDLESLFESVNEHKAWEAGDAA